MKLVITACDAGMQLKERSFVMLVQEGVVYIKLMCKWPEEEIQIPQSPLRFIIFFCIQLMSESDVQCGAKSWGSCFPRKQVLITADTLLSANQPIKNVQLLACRTLPHSS
jgi:hypothetical protein